ncbi:MAG: hypothetical protein R3230_01430 [Nitrosopumilaceae archaeon]|nr:hypothetical protein [Nitrosopumilaceae archaeon]
MSKKEKSKQKEVKEIVEETQEFTKNISTYPWEQERIKNRKPVKGIFRFFESPGGTLRFSYLKYKGDPLEKFELTDGEVYTIPLGVAKHLRNSGWYPVHAYQLDENEKPSKKIGQKVHRFTFEPLEFVSDEELNNPHHNKDKEIVTVSR